MSTSRHLIRPLGAATLSGLVCAVAAAFGVPLALGVSLVIAAGSSLFLARRWTHAAAGLAAMAAAASTALWLDLAMLPWMVAAFACVAPAERDAVLTAGQRVTASATGALLAAGTLFLVASLPPVVPVALSAGLLAALMVGSVAVAQAVGALDVSRNTVSRWRVQRTLRPRYRPPVYHALTRASQGGACTRDTDVRDGLDTVARWVFSLQHHLQQVERDITLLRSTTPAEASPSGASDPFALKKHAAAQSLRSRREKHIDTLTAEAERTQALADYALAWLEDAVASLTVAQRTADVRAPIDMDRILAQLQAHERERDALRRTRVELA